MSSDKKQITMADAIALFCTEFSGLGRMDGLMSDNIMVSNTKEDEDKEDPYYHCRVRHYGNIRVWGIFRKDTNYESN